MNASTKERIAQWLILHHLLSFSALAKARYAVKFKRLPHIKKPRDLNEHILHDLLCTDVTPWARLADKYAVREYVAEQGLADILPKCYGVWESADDIDFDALPQQFVLKPTSGCGEVVVVDDKDKIDREAIKAQINEWLDAPFGYYTAEPHYTYIKNRVIAEELLPNENPESSSIIDYKFMMINGEPAYCMMCANRDTCHHKADFVLYDPITWECHPEWRNHKYDNSASCPRPDLLAQMVECARTLSHDWPIVRVDLYQANGRVYFGEMTMSSNGGRMLYLTDEKLRELGALLATPA